MLVAPAGLADSRYFSAARVPVEVVDRHTGNELVALVEKANALDGVVRVEGDFDIDKRIFVVDQVQIDLFDGQFEFGADISIFDFPCVGVHQLYQENLWKAWRVWSHVAGERKGGAQHREGKPRRIEQCVL